MAESSADSPPKSSLSDAVGTPKRVHSYSRLTTAIAVLALAIAAYALWRLDATRDRLDQINVLAHSADAERAALQGELRALDARERQNARTLGQRLDELNAVSKQLHDVSAAVEELHGRAEGPQRAWSRAEALFLMEIAQRSLVLDRDVATAIAALESADSRLASVRDPALTSVRQQLAAELHALRTARVPDRTGLLARLAAAEEQAARLPVKGIVELEPTAQEKSEWPEGFFARARAIVRNALADLIRVRTVDERSAVVTQDEQLIRRQHLQLLLFTARAALVRHDQPAYRTALASARQWVAEFFDIQDASSNALLREIQLLEAIAIDPPLPDISKSAESLQRLAAQRSGTVEK